MPRNYDPKSVPRRVDSTPIYDKAHDRGASVIATIDAEVTGARDALLSFVDSVGNVVVANLAKDPAIIVGTLAGPYNIGAGNKVLDIVVNDDGVTHTVTLTEDAATTAQEVVDQINAVSALFAKAYAFLTEAGTVAIVSRETGITSQLETQNDAAEAYATLGLFEGVVQGDAKQWNTARAAALSALNTAILQIKNMTELANDTEGNTPERTL